jgi:hypothetical protein
MMENEKAIVVRVIKISFWIGFIVGMITAVIVNIISRFI